MTRKKFQEIFSQHYRKRDALIPILQDIQGAFVCLPPEAMAAAKFCHMDPVEVYGARDLLRTVNQKRRGIREPARCDHLARMLLSLPQQVQSRGTNPWSPRTILEWHVTHECRDQYQDRPEHNMEGQISRPDFGDPNLREGSKTDEEGHGCL